MHRDAVRALASLNATSQLEALIAELEGPKHREDWEVRVAIVETLGSFRNPAAGPALARLLRDSDDRVAEQAIESVSLIGYRDAYGQLADLFRNSPDDDMREQALQSIALMRNPQAQGLFESLLFSREDKERELAAEGLARLDYGPADFATRIAEEDDAAVRLAQAFLLVASGEGSYVSRLVNALDTRRRPQAEVYLYELGRYEGRIDLLYPHLRNPDGDIREHLVRVMGRIGDPAARPYVQPLTEDRDSDVSAAAVAALRLLVAR